MILNLVKKKKKLLLSFLICLFCLWALFLALFPIFLSKGFLCKQLNKQIKGEIAIKKASLSWFKPQTFQEISFTDEKKQLVIEIESLKTSSTLLDLLLNPKNLRETQISGLKGFIIASKDKSSNIVANLSPSLFIPEKQSLSKKSSTFVLKIPITGQFHIDRSDFTIKSLDQDSIHFQDIQFNCTIPENLDSLSAHLACETTQNELSGSMHVNIEVGGFDQNKQLIFTPLDRDIFFLSPDGYLNLTAEITNLPSESLDHLFSFYNPKLNNLFSNAAGGPLNCGAQLHIVKSKTKMSLSAHANDLDLRFSGALQQNQFFLTEPSTCRFYVKPLFIESLAKAFSLNSNFSIEKPTEALIQIDRMTMPLDFKNFNFSNLSCNAGLSLSPMKFIGKDKTENFEIKQVKGTIDTFDLNENVTLHLNATAYKNKHPIHFKVDGQLSKLIDSQKELIGMDQIKAYFVAQAKDFPTALALHFFKEKDLALELLGPSFNLDTKFNGALSNADISINLNSSRIQIPDIVFKLRNKNLLTLLNPTQLSIRVNPSLAKKAFSSKFALLQPIHLKGDLLSCEFEVKENKLSLALLDLGLHASSFDFFASTYKPCHVSQIFAQITKNYSSELSAEFTTELKLPQDMPFYELDKTCNAHFFIENFSDFISGRPTLLQTNLDSKNWNAFFNGYIDRKWNYDLLQEATAQIKSFSFCLDNNKRVEIPKLCAYLSPSLFNLLDTKLDKIGLSGSFFIDSLTIQNEAFSQCFEELKIPFEYSGVANSLKLSVKSAKNTLNANIVCQSLISSNGIDLKNADYKVFTTIKNLSPNCLKIFFKEAYDYESILGRSIDLEANLNFIQKETFSGGLQYELSSSILHSKGNLTFGEKVQLAKDGLIFDYFMSPASFAAITKLLKNPKAASLLLEEPLTLKMQINKLNKPLLTHIKEAPLAFDGNMTIDKFITNKGSFFDLSGSFNTSNILNNLKVDLSAKTNSADLKEGMAYLSAELTNPICFDTKGINPQIDGFMSCKLLHFPTLFLSDLATLKSKELEMFAELLGPSFDLTCFLKLKSGKGPFNFEVRSNNLFSKFSLNFDKDHLYLEEDLKADFKLSDENIKLWLKAINPLFSSIYQPDMMAKITISKENFSAPLSLLSLSQIQIESAKIEIEKIKLQKTDLYSKILKLLKSNSESREVSLWLTPIYFSLKNGLLETFRIDMLLNNQYHLALWGDYNLKQKKGSYFLSFPQNTLKKVFALKKLPPKYMFQIPINGPLDHLNIDWATAAAQLGILSLTSSLDSPAQSLYHNPNANLNEILDVFAKSQPAGNSPEPMSLLPWESEECNKKSDSNVRKRESTPDEQTAILQDFFKQLRKVIKR